MNYSSPKLICASPDIAPGTIKITFQGKRGPDHLMLAGNDADNLMEHWRSAAGEGEQHRLLMDMIEAARGAA